MNASRSLRCSSLALGAVLSACTLNVKYDTQAIEASYAESDWSVLRVVPEPAEHLSLYAADQSGIDAALTVEALGGLDPSFAAESTGVGLVFESAADGVVELYPASLAAGSDIRLSELTVWAPMPAGIDLLLGATDATVVGFCGPVTVVGGAADLVVETLGPVGIELGSGNVSVFADLGAVYTQSGDIAADIAGIAVLETESGNVAATLGAGGGVTTGTGNVAIVLTDPGFGELWVTTGAGDVAIELPAGASPVIDVSTGAGNVAVDGDLTVYYDGAAVGVGCDGGCIVVRTGVGNVAISY